MNMRSALTVYKKVGLSLHKFRHSGLADKLKFRVHLYGPGPFTSVTHPSPWAS